jgi:hypothetical protein
MYSFQMEILERAVESEVVEFRESAFARCEDVSPIAFSKAARAECVVEPA